MKAAPVKEWPSLFFIWLLQCRNMKYVFLYRVNRNNMKLRKYYPTIVLSDIHLGSEHSRTEEVTNFLKHVNCGRLILNGDIIDGWQLRKSGRRWKQQHTDFFKVLMKMMESRERRLSMSVGITTIFWTTWFRLPFPTSLS